MRTAVVVFGVLGQNGDAYFLLNDVHTAVFSESNIMVVFHQCGDIADMAGYLGIYLLIQGLIDPSNPIRSIH